MEILAQLASVIPNVFTLINLLILLAGVLAGVIVGALPGFTPTMGVAILVPFTFGMSPEGGLILLGGVYCASVYAGALTAILFNIPGAPANIATLFDGHPMAKQGRAKEAIYYASTASLIGGIVGMIALILFSPPLAAVSLKFGPAEIFWVAIFGVTIIASLSVGSMIKGLIGGAIGLLLSTIGVDSVTGTYRYVFDSDTLLAGIDIVAGLIGLFALSQVLVFFEEIFTRPEGSIRDISQEKGDLGRTMIDTFRRFRALSIGSIVGTIIGIIPGAGGQVAALTAYNEAKRWAPRGERGTFGTGNPDGVISCEAANNAMAGGSLVPLFTLGIPGSPTAAVLLGGLMIHGLFPGHNLFTEHAHVTYTFMLAMILAQFCMFAVGISITRYFARILAVPQYYLGPAIMALCVIGAFATRNSMGDVYVMAVLGILMYVGLKFGFSPAGVVLGLILGDIAENGFVLGSRLGLAEGSVGAYFLLRPICLVVMILVVLSVIFALIMEYKGSRSPGSEGSAPNGLARLFDFESWRSFSGITMRQWNLLIGILLLGGIVVVYLYSLEFPEEVRVFPLVILTALAVMAIWLVLQSLFLPSKRSPRKVFENWPGKKMAAVIGFTVLYLLLAEIVGFYVSTFLYMATTPLFLKRQTDLRFFLKCGGVAFGFVGIMLLVFQQLLKVPTPHGFLF